MGLKNRIAQMILNNSDSYKQSQKDIKKLKKKVEKLEKVNKSTNRLLNTIFLDYELTPTDTLRNFQLLSIELLRLMDNICSKHDLEWMIESGTFLGAIRHGGFIPWDDDLDSGMMRTDYNKLIEVLPVELEKLGLIDDFWLRFRPRDEFVEGATSFLQIFYRVKEPYPLNIAALDVFAYDYLKEYNGEDIGELYEQTRVKFYHDVVEIDDFDTVLERYYENLNLTYEETPYILQSVEGPAGPRRVIKLHVLETEKIKPFKKVQFENLMLPGPKDSDYYLNLIYKNYRNIPQSLTFHNRLKKLRKFPNIDEVFEKSIMKLREVNDNFE